MCLDKIIIGFLYLPFQSNITEKVISSYLDF